MKRAVSISIGSTRRDKMVEISLLGERVCIERIGTDGDMVKAASLFRELDGKVDAFGVGGTDLGVLVDHSWYPLYSVASLVKGIHTTPVVDGNGLKITLERRVAKILNELAGDYLTPDKRSVLVVSAVDRYGMASSFIEAGYHCLFGDLMFTLGLPLRLHSLSALKRLAAILMPVAGRLPFHWIYPTGQAQEKHVPKWADAFAFGTVIAGDAHYIIRNMPPRLDGKVIVTNTTTPEDVRLFREAGVKYLLTTTPVLEGRSFGTNMMEAAILAAAGRRAPVDYSHADEYIAWLNGLLNELPLEPQLQELN